MKLGLIGALLLIVASAATCSAAPIAYYNPTTGNLRIEGLEDAYYLSLFSDSAPLLKENAIGPIKGSFTNPNNLVWSTRPSYFEENFSLGKVVTPLTALSALRLSFLGTPETRGPISVGLVSVPEPTTVAMAITGVCALAALRRRR